MDGLPHAGTAGGGDLSAQGVEIIPVTRVERAEIEQAMLERIERHGPSESRTAVLQLLERPLRPNQLCELVMET